MNLFILGAGSSASYGLPTGVELKNKILSLDINETNHTSGKDFYISKLIEKYNKENSFANLKKFQDDFRLAGSSTIDTFLSSDFRSIHEVEFGKFLISTILYFEENKFIYNNATTQNNQDNWIEYLFSRLISYNLEGFTSSPFKVISFNYDNLFRKKLENHLELEHGFQGAKNFISHKNIINHVYGNFTFSNYQKQDFLNDLSMQLFRVDKLELFYKQIIQNASRVSFIRGNINPDDNPKIKSIREMIDKASRIYILGYGFDRFNNQILFDNEVKVKNKSKFVEFTTYGLSLPMKYELNKVFRPIKMQEELKTQFDERNQEKINRNEKCLEFLARVLPPPLFPE